MSSHRIDEALIERFIAFPETLPEDTLREVQQHLETDPFAREVARFYRSYYSILRDLPDDETPGSDSDPRCPSAVAPSSSSEPLSERPRPGTNSDSLDFED